ncbi:MAG: NAD(P)-dependent oxidoreductase [Anaerolineae bacterium]|nr:NAD(P)-dependent oxidoreductase [Anaerolineae bacterium]
MTRLSIGFLHPGAMGISLAASAQNSGCTVYWASEGRSKQTHERAAEHGLRDAQTLRALCEVCDVVVSVCPPHAAEEVAAQVRACAFRGLYLDANAISPMRTQRIGREMARVGIAFVDGSIIGGPAWEPRRTWLYLAGTEAGRAAGCFSAGPLETCVVGEEIGKAAALKMCFAAYTKGSTALLCAILAAAEELGVRPELEAQWSRGGSDFARQTQERVRQVTTRAWRFAGEMEEIAATFEQAGLPGGFHAAAADVYRRIAHFKDVETPSLDEVLEALAEAERV